MKETVHPYPGDIRKGNVDCRFLQCFRREKSRKDNTNRYEVIVVLVTNCMNGKAQYVAVFVMGKGII